MADLGPAYKPGNLKGKPNAQGTLFAVADKSLLNQQKRWPRGYTPERQAEVRDTVGSVVHHEGARRAVGYGIPLDELKNLDPEARSALVAEKQAAMEKAAARRAKPELGQYRAMVVDRLARSALSIRQMAGLKRIDMILPDGSGETGAYYPNHQSMIQAVPRGIDIRGHKMLQSSLLHEMGHHVDPDLAQGGPAVEGRNEAYADSLEAEEMNRPSARGKALAEPYVSDSAYHAGAREFVRMTQEGRRPRHPLLNRRRRAESKAYVEFTESYLKHYSHGPTHPAAVVAREQAAPRGTVSAQMMLPGLG